MEELVSFELDPMAGLVILKSVGHCGLVMLGVVDIAVLGNPAGLILGGPGLVILGGGMPVDIPGLVKAALMEGSTGLWISCFTGRG